jgi:hypothetical protein
MKADKEAFKSLEDHFKGVSKQAEVVPPVRSMRAVKPSATKARGAVVIREGMDDYKGIPSLFGSARKLPGGGGFMSCLTGESVQMRILTLLANCRGGRARAESLVVVLEGADKSSRRLHNTSVVLFRRGLVEKVRGMYQITSAGLEVVVGV